MLESERPEFAEVVVALAATFRQESSAALIQGYWMGLVDLSIADVRRAAAKAIRGSRFLPTPCELRELAGMMLPADRAALAWDAVVKATDFHGYYDSVDFDDKLVNATIRGMGGWIRFSERLEAEETKWLRKEFCDLYATYSRTGVGPEAVAYLEGYFEQSNAGKYQSHVGPPIPIETGLPPHPAGLIPDSVPPARRLTHLPEVDAAVKAAD